jgi:uncharacterized membrane protein YdbT with pleckstrin-like domain
MKINAPSNARPGATSTSNTGEQMSYPPYLNLVKLISEITAALAVIIGVIGLISGFPAFQYGFMYGVTAITASAISIVSALVGLGIVYGFITMVMAQVDIRNAVIQRSDAFPATK